MSAFSSKPFDAIALALSGGGYRAAAFHLGLLRTLSDIGLLQDVAILSTVSGGTFVGAAYAVACCTGESFDTFFKKFRERLQTQRPVHRAAYLLVSEWNLRLPRCTLVAAHAEAIDEQFFHGACFGKLFDEPSHLEEIAFNATDFRTGLPFRFQKSCNSRAKIGNGKNFIPVELARQLRIADVVAASSCFPGGFEPLGFPHDFHWQERSTVLRQFREMKDDSPFSKPIPLMDGGVADNQGVGSLMAALDRRKPEQAPVGLILISDADQAPNRPLLEHQLDPQPKGMRLSSILLTARVLFCVSTIASVLLGCRLFKMFATRNFGSWFFFVETVFSLVVVFSTLVALAWTGRVIKKYVWDRVPRDVGIDIVGTVKQTTVGWLGELLWMRLESLFTMSNSVFMKSLRDLRYRDLFSNGHFRDRVIANMIYDLAKTRKKTEVEGIEPTSAMRSVAERTREVPTSLWFDDERQLDEAILCGRFTACYNLIKHIEKKEATERTQAMNELLDALKKMWEQFEVEVAQPNHHSRAGENPDWNHHSIQPPPRTRSAA